MSNPFLNNDCRDVETAILLEQAFVHDIGKAVAYTDGDRVFINTEDNLFDLLPAYDNNMLKWLLWHERYHKELRHHNRFFRYLKELSEQKTMDEFQVTKDEVNIIMDILVHDSLAKLFPELVETAVNNLAQMRNRNSLGYTFKTHTLEEMLNEYKEHKRASKEEPPTDEPPTGEPPTGEPPIDEPIEEPPTKSKSKPKEEPPTGEPPTKSSTSEPPVDEPPAEEPTGSTSPEPEPEHDKTDWSKLKDIDNKEFIEKNEGDDYIEQIDRLKRKKFKLSKLTQTLNGLATTTRQRSYSMPSTIHAGKGILLKGRTPGKTALYLCFDASGSMNREMETFKDIISKSIPQAMDVPTTWFSGFCYRGSVDHCKDPEGRSKDYYKGKFRDFMNVMADNGYNDDGDRTIELCWKAEQLGYSPIGVTDGGGQISWSKEKLKQLKRTVLVGQSKWWLEEAQRINPKIQIIDI